MSKRLPTPLGPFWTHDIGTITRALENGQWWDAHLKPILDDWRFGGWALDLGANIGWFTYYLSQSYVRVIACEPWPETYALLWRNLGTLPGVSCWPVAAYDRPALLDYDPRNDATDAGGYGFTPRTASNSSYPGVPAIRLDDYLPPDAPVEIIKSDCQGVDLRALRGLSRTIARCRPLIVFEWEAEMAKWQGDTWEDYLAFFAAQHYTVERITPHFWDYVARPLPLETP
jgi:FkbM family methyltransferase